MKPILFNTDMVRAVLEDRKTVTRRAVKPQPKSHIAYACMGNGCGKWGYPGKDAWEYWDDESFRLPDGISQDELKRRWTPPCNTGDILYVRETWYKDPIRYMYKANYSDTEKFFRDGKEVQIKWRPSIHMPKEAARLFLRVTDVQVERLLTPFFSDGAAVLALKKEGIVLPHECVECIGNYGKPACVDSSDDSECGVLDEIRGDFSDLWNSTINPADLPIYGWNANPWVWVIEFERVSKEAALKGGDG